MAVDLFDLVMNLRTTGTASAAAELKGVESAGVRTAASLNTVSASLDRSASAALNGTKGFRDLSGAYAAHAPVAAAAAKETENLGAKLSSVALTGVQIAAVGAAFAGLAGFLFESAKEAGAAQEVHERLRVAVRGAGLEWATYKEQLNGAAEALGRNTTFTDEEADEALAKLVLATHDAGRAQELLGVAADLAAFKHISLSSAVEVVTRALSGYTRGLREFGITTKDGEEAVAQLGAMLSGQAAAQAQTFDGRLKQMANSWTEFKESVGMFVLSTGLTDFLANSAREFNTLAGMIEKVNRALGFGKSSDKFADQDTGQLNARLASLRARATGQAPGFLGAAGITGSVGALTGDALTKNLAEQADIQRELVEREKAHALQVVLAANKQHEIDEQHVAALADGFKLHTLTKAEDQERLATVKELRAQQEGANLEERNHLQTLINSLLPKAETQLAKLRRLELLEGSPVKPTLDLMNTYSLGGPAMPGRLPNTTQTAAQPRQGHGGAERDAGYMQGATFMDRMRQGLTDGLARMRPFGESLTNFFQNIFSGARVGRSLADFGKEILAGMGSIFAQMAAKAILAAPLFIAIGKAMQNPFTAGFALLAFGIALSALGKSMGGAATGGGSSGGQSLDRTTEIHLSAPGSGGFGAPQAKAPFTVLGVETPLGQRVLASSRKAGMRRGLA